MLIGLSGYAGAGKDAFAKALTDHHGYRRASFAARLYETAYTLNPYVDVNGNYVRLQILVDAAGWERAKRAVPEVRRLLQVMGTDVGRDLIDPDVWVNIATRGLAAGERVAFTDLRFPNEAAAIRRLGGVVVRVTRPGVGPVNDHVSEQVLAADHVIRNRGSLRDLEHAAAGLMRRIQPV